MHSQGRLTSANLGDSGFLVLGEPQPGENSMHVKYHSPQQEHQFGFPYQLGHHEHADNPDAAMLMTLPVSLLGKNAVYHQVRGRALNPEKLNPKP